jgi:hypothetical protein
MLPFLHVQIRQTEHSGSLASPHSYGSCSSVSRVVAPERIHALISYELSAARGTPQRADKRKCPNRLVSIGGWWFSGILFWHLQFMCGVALCQCIGGIC